MNWINFILLFVAISLIGFFLRVLIKRKRLSDSADRLILTILVLLPLVVRMTLRNRLGYDIYYIVTDYISASYGLACGWSISGFIDQRKQKREKQDR